MRSKRLHVMDKITEEKLDAITNVMDVHGMWYVFIDTSKTGNYNEGLGVTGDVICLKTGSRSTQTISLGDNLDIGYLGTKLYLNDYVIDLKNAMTSGQVAKIALIIDAAVKNA